jgi:ribosomal protein S27AE
MTASDDHTNRSEGRGEEFAAPAPCPRCGHTARLFTPNARREPFSAVPHYEAAWQCTRCGHLEFAPYSKREAETDEQPVPTRVPSGA